MSNESLTVVDNRTGRKYELPIIHGAIHAMDFQQITISEENFGLMSYDPALQWEEMLHDREQKIARPR